MARNDRDQQIEKFLSRSRSRRNPPPPLNHPKRQQRIVNVNGFLTSTDPLSQSGPGFAKHHPLSAAKPVGMTKAGRNVRVPRPKKRAY